MVLWSCKPLLSNYNLHQISKICGSFFRFSITSLCCLAPLHPNQVEVKFHQADTDWNSVVIHENCAEHYSLEVCILVKCQNRIYTTYLTLILSLLSVVLAVHFKSWPMSLPDMLSYRLFWIPHWQLFCTPLHIRTNWRSVPRLWRVQKSFWSLQTRHWTTRTLMDLTRYLLFPKLFFVSHN